MIPTIHTPDIAIIIIITVLFILSTINQYLCSRSMKKYIDASTNDPIERRKLYKKFAPFHK